MEGTGKAISLHDNFTATILVKTTWENVFINAHYLTQQNYFQINGFA